MKSDNSAPGVTARCGAWASALTFDTIPQEVIAHAKLCLLDGLGCALYGATQPWGRIAAQTAVEMSGGRATLWGHTQTAGVSDAALVNGTAAHGFEIDDVHVRSLMHPGAATIPAALALAEMKGASGRQLLAAIVAGYEIGLRTGICAGIPHCIRGFHPTGTAGCPGAAAAGANILELAPEQATHAIAIATTQAAGLYSAVRTGAMTKRMHAGRAAQSGVVAALLARLMAAKMTDALGQAVIVDNRAGAGGTIAAEMVARAAPDGYILNAPTNSYAVNANFLKLSYDPIADITPIAVIGTSGYLMVVHPSVPARTLKELLALARARPGALNYGSTGQGAISHLAVELFKLMAKVDLTHVPYKGTAGVLTDLLSGQIQFTAGAIPPTLPHVKSGRLRAIGVSTAQRSKLVPEVPTVSDAGVPGYDVASWYAISGPPRLPQDIVARLSEVIKRTLALPDIVSRFEQEGVDVAYSTPEEFAKLIKADIDKWAKVAKVVTIKE